MGKARLAACINYPGDTHPRSPVECSQIWLLLGERGAAFDQSHLHPVVSIIYKV